MNQEVHNLLKIRSRAFKSGDVNPDHVLSQAPNGITISVNKADDGRYFRNVSPQQASGPNDIPGRIPKTCSDHLAGVFADIFSLSLLSCHVPTCFKGASIILVPKKSKVTCLNNYRPVALTCAVMKGFERLVIAYIRSYLSNNLDLFACHHSRSIASLALHSALDHFDNTYSFIRLLFTDYSSALTTIIPCERATNLRELDLYKGSKSTSVNKGVVLLPGIPSAPVFTTTYVKHRFAQPFLSYILKVFLNQKLWMNQEVHNLLKIRSRAFKSGDVNPDHVLSQAPNGITISVNKADDGRYFRNVSPQQASGPNDIPGRIPKTCSDHLAGVFADIFNLSLLSCHVPTCFKGASIILVPKKSKVTCLNNYRPVALTCAVMKGFERLVIAYIRSYLSNNLDLFACHHSRSIASLALHSALDHFDNRYSFIRLLFTDYSSALTTIIPCERATNLRELDLYKGSKSTSVNKGVVLLPGIPSAPVFTSYNPNHNYRVCSTWGNYHFKTFDGDVYHFPGTCNYVFASQCLSLYEEFNIQIRRTSTDGHPRISHIIMKIEGSVVEVINSVIYVDDNVVMLPFAHSGIMIENVSNHTHITAKIGLTLTWNGDDALELQLGQQFVNTTCGLCGDFNGILENDFTSNGYHVTPIQFGNLQKLNGPTEHCKDVLSDAVQNCSEFESVCENVLKGPDFASCYNTLDISPFIKSCMLDLCQCIDLTQSSSCLCNTLSEFSRQCAHVGGKPANWRRDGLCEKTCQLNMTYEECGTPCADMCSNPYRSQMCDDHCIDGCFCPPNTVFDDISNNGCIPKERCPCTYNGQSYATGESYSTKCSKCICNGEQWSCTDRICPGICSIEGGAHINTFDESHYTFHGKCYYVLAKDCRHTMFTVLGELQPCGITETETCLKSVVVTAHGTQTTQTIISITPTGIVSVNAIVTQLPVTTANITVFKPSNFHVILHTSFGLQLQIQLVPLMQLYISLDPYFKNRMCGLCGNFNDILNEFMIATGIVEGTSATFANTWKTKASCPDRKDYQENPCSLSVENAKYAKHWCGLLLAEDSVFAQCHSQINPETYYQQCKYDTCNCERSEDCMCAALSAYVQACAAKGMVISNWRADVCSKYTNCPKTLVYSYNMTSCQRTCQSLAAPDRTCEVSTDPVDGCGCAEGTYMDDTGKCVEPSDCPCYYKGTIVPAGEVIHENDAMCTCNMGKLDCIGDGSEVQVCVSPMVYFDCQNASPGSAGTECQKSCQTLDMECYATDCASGCVCPGGLLSDGNGGCIPLNECPCTHNSIQYQPGETLQVDCNSCVCNNRTWSCSGHECHGTCMIYGDGNYITFDGQRYTFNGDCEYIVAQDYCGNNPSNGNFRIITENIPCGTTGTTCSKSIKIFLGNTEIKLSDGKYETVKLMSGIQVPYKVRHLGIYLVLEASNGMILFWDKKTSLTIKLSHSHKGTMCGLCGNYDGNVHNDFTTRSHLVVANAEEFGNSWKVSPACANAKKTEDPCSINVHRDAWAQKQCSILKNEPFLSCNSQVDPAPYYESCVRDACACDTGGDCECLCTAIAAYSLACRMAGQCISWRTPELCPLFCTYYNPNDECEWHYAPCGIPCIKTCQNPSGACSKIIPKLEGCYPDCPSEKPFLDEDKMQCVPLGNCPCHFNGTYYEPGQSVPSTRNCESCKCTNGGVHCTYHKSACTCVYDGKTFHEGETIYHTTDGIGGCIKAMCGVNGTIIRQVYPCTPKTSTVPSTTLSFETTLTTPSAVPWIITSATTKTTTINSTPTGTVSTPPKTTAQTTTTTAPVTTLRTTTTTSTETTTKRTQPISTTTSSTTVTTTTTAPVTTPSTTTTASTETTTKRTQPTSTTTTPTPTSTTTTTTPVITHSITTTSTETTPKRTQPASTTTLPTTVTTTASSPTARTAPKTEALLTTSTTPVTTHSTTTTTSITTTPEGTQPISTTTSPTTVTTTTTAPVTTHSITTTTSTQTTERTQPTSTTTSPTTATTTTPVTTQSTTTPVETTHERTQPTSTTTSPTTATTTTAPVTTHSTTPTASTETTTKITQPTSTTTTPTTATTTKAPVTTHSTTTTPPTQTATVKTQPTSTTTSPATVTTTTTPVTTHSITTTTSTETTSETTQPTSTTTTPTTVTITTSSPTTVSTVPKTEALLTTSTTPVTTLRATTTTSTETSSEQTQPISMTTSPTTTCSCTVQGKIMSPGNQIIRVAVELWLKRHLGRWVHGKGSNDYGPNTGQATVTSADKSGLCNFTLCTEDCKVLKYTGRCDTTTRPAETTTAATTVTVTPTSSGTTPCTCEIDSQIMFPACHQQAAMPKFCASKTFPGVCSEEIHIIPILDAFLLNDIHTFQAYFLSQATVSSASKSGLCNFTLCTEDCQVVKYTGRCETTTRPVETTTPATTVTPVISKLRCQNSVLRNQSLVFAQKWFTFR
ncbi:mucin-2-like [Rhinoraja longicauda]